MSLKGQLGLLGVSQVQRLHPFPQLPGGKDEGVNEEWAHPAGRGGRMETVEITRDIRIGTQRGEITDQRSHSSFRTCTQVESGVVGLPGVGMGDKGSLDGDPGS